MPQLPSKLSTGADEFDKELVGNEDYLSPLTEQEEAQEIRELEKFVLACFSPEGSPESARDQGKPSLSSQDISELVNEAILDATGASPVQIPQLRKGLEKKITARVRLRPHDQLVVWKEKSNPKHLR